MQHLPTVEAELNSYLQGIIEQWHKTALPSEQEVRDHLRSLFARLGSDEERCYLQARPWRAEQRTASCRAQSKSSTVAACLLLAAI